MNLLKNKHIILAMFIAPVLAIIAYFATDSIVSEKPHQALEGEQYKLAARSNCRYESGICTLHNGDLEIDLRVSRLSDSRVLLDMQSNLPLQQVLASIANSSYEPAPVPLDNQPDQLTWFAELPVDRLEQSEVRVVVMLSDTLFYASIPTVFVDYETTFPRDNFTGQ